MRHVLALLFILLATAKVAAYPRCDHYVQRHHGSGDRPLLVMLHGTNGKGSLLISRLRPLADRERFIVVAPDSVSPSGVWDAGQRPDQVTDDYRHIMRCVRQVMAFPGVRVDPGRVLIAGVSVGGAAAAYVATHEELFTAFAVLHGHIIPEGFGPRRVPGWFSAGDRDRRRTVEQVRRAAEHLRRDRHFPDIEMRVFRAEHALPDDELHALVAWWLHRDRRSAAGMTAGARSDEPR